MIETERTVTDPTDTAITRATAQLLVEYGDVESAERAAAARIQSACNASERRFWDAVRARLSAPVGGSAE